MFGFGYMEVGIVGVLAVLLFGNKLPKLARSLGSSFVELKKGLAGVEDEVKEIGDSAKAQIKDIEGTVVDATKDIEAEIKA